MKYLQNAVVGHSIKTGARRTAIITRGCVPRRMVGGHRQGIVRPDGDGRGSSGPAKSKECSSAHGERYAKTERLL